MHSSGAHKKEERDLKIQQIGKNGRKGKGRRINIQGLVLAGEMKVFTEAKLFVVLWSLLLAGRTSEASLYNYSASIECLVNPLEPQYEGGLVANPNFEDGIEGWGRFGDAKIEARRASMGNKFIVAYNRSQPYDSFSQWLYLEEGLLYSFSAWVQISEGNEIVVAKFRNSQNLSMIVGSVIAQPGCWSMLKGGLTVDVTMPAELHFESKNTSIELWVDNVSLQPFTRSQWRDQQSKSLKKIRKRRVRFHVSNKKGKRLQGVKINIKQTRPHFPLGCATALTILENKAYQNWFTKRFTATTFDNEMKWYFTEEIRGHENYSIPDAMLAFAKQHRISVRGHNIFWDNPKYNMDWVRSMSPKELLSAAMTRMGSIMSRYSGEVIAWDVMNENLHFSFFEDKIGPNASAMFYKIAQALDYETPMFMNEYNTLEYVEDMNSIPAKYVEKLRKIKSFLGNEEMVVGIGLQGHFSEPNIAYMRASLDFLGATKMPIWITELDVERGSNQATYLEEIMREAYSHPAVEGIIVWSGWKPTGCSNMCLTNNDFKNLPAGDVVDKLIEEWKTDNLQGVTDENGVYANHIFHGEYIVTVSNAFAGENLTKHLVVTSDKSEPFDVWISI
ncbi:endo-1,4-beta-xylanase 4-like isoform X2 [Cornus florida]|uniref:endo-1,4-beta-xylanase 4-like isoform X2 n=1 Tax=Cornus florida TaxID=4283 RepID=UPI00289C623E|nr:endo-1,4-beta-xylanase 4-like isoform X2 [Cornus florida]